MTRRILSLGLALLLVLSLSCALTTSVSAAGDRAISEMMAERQFAAYVLSEGLLPALLPGEPGAEPEGEASQPEAEQALFEDLDPREADPALIGRADEHFLKLRTQLQGELDPDLDSPEDITVYFVDETGTETPYVYFFIEGYVPDPDDTSEDLLPYPGGDLMTGMLEAPLDKNGNPYYAITLDSTVYTHIIFNNGSGGGVASGNQTADLPFPADARVDAEGRKYVVYHVRYDANHQMAANSDSTDVWPAPKQVLVAPTCTEPGLEAYVGLRTGALAEQTTLAALGHLPQDPVEENRVEPTASADGSYDTVVYCQRCGQELSRETVILKRDLKFIPTMSVGIELVTKLVINRFNLNAYQDWYLEITVHEPADQGGDRVLRYSRSEPNGMTEDQYVWALRFKEISAKKLGVSFEATVHAVDAAGQKYLGPTIELNMRNYVLDALTAANSDSLKRTLAADILNYCAQAQQYFSYDASNLVNQNLTAAQAQALATYTSGTPSAAITNDPGAVPTLNAATTLGARLAPSLTTKGLSIPANATVTIRVTRGSELVAELETRKLAPGFYNAAYTDMKANMMRTPYTYTVYVDGQPYSAGDPLVWSFEGYVKAAIDRNDPNLPMYYAVLKYIDSSVAMFPNS